MIIPQLIVIFLYAIALVISPLVHGRPRAGEHNAFAFAVGSCIANAILYWGGFYDELIRRLFE